VASSADADGSVVSYPFVVTTGVNDTLVVAQIAPPGNGTPTTFTVPPGSYVNAGDLVSGLNAAVDVDSNPITDIVTFSVSEEVTLVATSTVPGAWSNSLQFQSGGDADIVAGLGFTAGQLFALGAGGDPESTQGAATVHIFSIPAS
jgi:hypothetical protein